MSVRNLFDVLISRLPTAPSRRQRRMLRERIAKARPLRLEALEERRVLAFDLAVNYSTGSGPQDVLSADFNNDGRLDIATANANSSNVSVLLGNTDGTFQPAQSSPTGGSPQSIAVGDFNEDGKLDLATANYGDVSVLLGNGNGTFGAPANINIGSSPSSLSVGDFNADGNLDLGVTSNVYYPGFYSGGGYYGGYWTPGYYNGKVNVLLGTGTGSFAAPNTTVLGTGYHRGAAVADFNSDGKQEFATVNRDNGTVSVLLGSATGLGAPTNFTTGWYPQAVTVGDFTGDGILDLATAGQTVDVLPGYGNGTFNQVVRAFIDPVALAAADFNGDGKLDLVTADYGNSVSVLLGTGTGTFRPPLDTATGAGTAGVAVGDFNGDGRLDVASANSSSDNVSVLLNDGAWPALNAPAITIDDVTVTEGNTGTVNANFTVSLSAAYGQTVTVHYATADGSATLAGGDYQTASGDVTFTPGVTSQTITVLVNGDRIGEYSESFSVNLSDAANAFVADATGVGIITDDEPHASIVGYVEGAEGNTGTTSLNFLVTLSIAYDIPVTIDYATADLTPDEQYWYGPGATAGVDYTATAGTLTIPAGETSGTIPVPVIGDRVGESYEYFFVNLSNASGAQLDSSQSFGAIIDDEPYVSINSGLSGPEGNAGTTPTNFTVSLSAVYDIDVTVSYTTVDGSALAGSDYVAATGTVTIPAGQISQSLPVQVIGDVLAESDEYFYVQLTGATNAALANNWGYAYITDDDTPPAIFMGDASIVEGNSGTKLMTFVVTLSKPSGTAVQVNFTTADGSAKIANNDYVAKSGTIFFAPGVTSQTITVTIKGDTKKEPNERFYVNLSAASGGTIGDSQGVGTIVNDDGSGNGNSKGSRLSTASATDAAIDDWMFSTRKKRSR